MTLKTRKLIFLGLFIVFIPLCLAIIFYSYGWRFNFESLTIQKTGAIYIETNPKGTSIKIDGKSFPDKSGFIQSGTLISNLIAKNYQLQIEKNGYYPYSKNIKVEPAFVSELINIILIPQKLELQSIISTPLKGSKIIDQNSINKIIIENEKKYYLYEPNSQSTLNINASFANFKKNLEVKKVSFHPFDQNKLIIEADNIYSLNTDRLKLETIIQTTNSITEKNKIIAWEIKNPQFHYVKEITKGKTKALELAYFNLMLKTENSFKLPENITSIIKISASENNSKIALLDSLDDLYIFDFQSQKFEKIAHDVKNFQFSPDEEKIAFLDKNGKINILFFEDLSPLKKKAGDVIGYNLKNKELIKNIFWHQKSSHLFIEYQNKTLDFVEIDDRPPLNQYSLLTEIQSIYYSLKENALYFTKENKLYSWELE